MGRRLATRPLSVGDSVDLMLEVMRGVGAAHRQGVVHRDLKPENVFLCMHPDGHLLGPKVLDFGISKLIAREGEQPVTLTGGGAAGTPSFMAPEQLRGDEHLDKRVDIYALGVIFYLLLTDRLPFIAESDCELFASILPRHAAGPEQLAEGLA